MTTYQMKIQIEVEKTPDGLKAQIGGTPFLPADPSAAESFKAARGALRLMDGESKDKQFDAALRAMSYEQFAAICAAMAIGEYFAEFAKSKTLHAGLDHALDGARAHYRKAKENAEPGGYSDLTKEGK